MLGTELCDSAIGVFGATGPTTLSLSWLRTEPGTLARGAFTATEPATPLLSWIGIEARVPAIGAFGTTGLITPWLLGTGATAGTDGRAPGPPATTRNATYQPASNNPRKTIDPNSRKSCLRNLAAGSIGGASGFAVAGGLGSFRNSARGMTGSPKRGSNNLFIGSFLKGQEGVLPMLTVYPDAICGLVPRSESSLPAPRAGSKRAPE